MKYYDLIEPKRKNVSNFELLTQKNTPVIKLFGIISSEDFEIITEQWAYSKKDLYFSVKRTGGANDSGRDIFCYRDKEKTLLDIYQCKHYENKIMPSDIYVEIGKLMYYTYIKEFIIPQHYFIISSKGCGPALTKLLEKPDNLRQKLIAYWNKYCKDCITSEKSINLNDDLKNHIQNFDFSIITEITPLEFIDDFEKTKYYSEWFGLRKFKRQQPPLPSDEIQASELNYVRKLFDAYESVNHDRIDNQSQLKPKHANHFTIQRKCFYSAEGLKQFSKDYMPNDETFYDLQEQIIDPVKSHILSTTFNNGVECLDSASRLAQTLEIGNNSLKEFVRSNDKIGILHQVANDDENLKWVNDNEIIE